MQVSLSKFFPKNTEYFYGFPYGQESGFFFGSHEVWKIEAIAARPLVCAGPRVKIVTFASTKDEKTWNMMRELGGSFPNQKQLVVFPPEINENIKGKRRNRVIKKALQELASVHKLVMAQPFSGTALEDKYRIPLAVSQWCNDKKNIPEYTPEGYYPKRHANFPNGKAFYETDLEIPLPCVVKVSASAGGDGVRICKSPVALSRAKKKFRRLRGTIFVEQFIDAKYNLGIQFGVPYNKDKPIEIIGVNEQLTTAEGIYLGAIVDLQADIPEVAMANQILLTHILPTIRERGWYGVGAFDVLIGKDGGCYFIDSNFRMSAMTSFLCLLKNNKIKKSFVTFMGSFAGSEAEFREKIFPIAKNGRRKQKLRLVALNEHDGVFHFNAAMLVNDRREIRSAAKYLLGLGIESSVLKQVSRRRKIKRSID